ncbi:MAG: tripartite tricarboxylate transporter substrate binding protein [Betaproteobacteria bacterium]|nr:tripartite tricarboxylate transporter substrate binding protein [Betaproteobacteria bacterium]
MSPVRFVAASATFAIVTINAMSGAHAANQYPDKPIRVIVPFAPGGGTDMIARVLLQEASAPLGVSIVVDNRGGAGGVVGTELGIRAPADGYTLTLGSGSYATSAALNELSYDPVRDITPIILIGDSPFIMTVNPAVAANTLQDLIRLAKAKPGSLSYGTTGTGGITHLAVELFDMMAGTRMVQIPYKGTAPALNDVIGGQIPVMLGTAPSTLPHVRSKRLRALAVTSAQRSTFAPELPTVSEAGVPGYEAVTWYAIWGPAKLPRAVVAQLNSELARALTVPEIRKKFEVEALEIRGGPPQVLEQLLIREIDKWKAVVKKANLKAAP